MSRKRRKKGPKEHTWYITEGPWPNGPLPPNQKIVAPATRLGKLAIHRHVLMAIPAIVRQAGPATTAALRKPQPWSTKFSGATAALCDEAWNVLFDPVRLYRLGFRRAILA